MNFKNFEAIVLNENDNVGTSIKNLKKNSKINLKQDNLFINFVIKEDIKAFWGFIRGDTVDLNKICRYDSKGNDNDNDDDVYLQVCSEDDQNVNTSYGSL